ncbi:MAG TPA: VOC family protein [Prolixibacteraceae bacterium]|jgi:catechol 2,3-dioxygenase-like lactoylglutathione lyase family enzyme
MELKNCSTVLFVKNIEISKDFYCNILGLPIDLDFGKNVILKSGLTIWEIQGDQIIPSTLGLEKISNLSYNRFELYFEVENLSDIFEILKEKNVRFLHEVHEEPWGQQTIRFFDPDNHLIEIGESMRQFVFRFYNQGLTVEQVSKRTSIPVGEVKRLINKTCDPPL